MPRQVQFTKENIISVAIGILRRDGAEALSARTICKEMGCSVSPLFRAYANMDEIMQDVRKAAEKIFSEYVADVCDYTPAFKEFGMRLVRFSKEEPNLSHFLFQEKGTRSTAADEAARMCLKQTETQFELSEEQCELMYRQLWPFATGIANLSSKEPDFYTDSLVGEMLSTQFMALLILIKSGKKVVNVAPQHLK